MTNAPPETPNVSLGSIRNSVLPIILVFEPVCAGRHDDFIALLFTETIFAQNAAFVLDTFLAAAAAFRTLLCNELIGGEIGKVIKRLDARLAQRHQHGFGQMRHICHCIFHTKAARSEEHTSELQSLMRISYAVLCLTKKKTYYILCTLYS